MTFALDPLVLRLLEVSVYSHLITDDNFFCLKP